MIEYTAQVLRRLLALLAVTGVLAQGQASDPGVVQKAQFPCYAALMPASSAYTESAYLGSNALILLEEHSGPDERLGTAYSLAEIFIPDVHELKTYYKDSPENGLGQIAGIGTISRHVGAALSINGDYYTNIGVTDVRNGTVVNSCVSNCDLCVIYDDGRMKAFRYEDLQTQKKVNKALKGAWQAWSFGPALLTENGKAIEDFSGHVDEYYLKRHPRTAIGYYAPGHYCVVMAAVYGADSPGVTLEELSRFFADLGCKQAYNLDGGGSSHMWFHGHEICYPSVDRSLADVIYIEDTTSGG